MLKRATYTGKDNILDAYDALNKDGEFSYSVWHSDKDIAFQYVGNDREKARQMLEDNLEAMESAQNTDLLFLKFHPDPKGKGYIDRKTPVISTTPVRVTSLEDTDEAVSYEIGSTSRPAGMPYAMWKAIGALENLPAAITTKLEAFDTRLKEIELMEIEEPEPVDPVQKAIGMVTGVLSNEVVMSALGQFLNFIKPQPAPVFNPLRVNGMSEQSNEPEILPAPVPEAKPAIDEDKLNDALNRLYPHCVLDTDMQLLAKMAESNPVLFKSMLAMLRSQN